MEAIKEFDYHQSTYSSVELKIIGLHALSKETFDEITGFSLEWSVDSDILTALLPLDTNNDYEIAEILTNSIEREGFVKKDLILRKGKDNEIGFSEEIS